MDEATASGSADGPSRGTGHGDDAVGAVRSGGGPAAVPIAGIAAGALVVAGSTAAMLQRLEPFTTWYYVFAWYGTLLVLDGLVALTGEPRAGSSGHGRGDRRLLLARPRHLATLLGWSAVAWLFFELLNFRLQNWYYVFLPDARAARWPAILVSFATVFPAIFLAAALLERLGVATRVRWPALRLTATRIRGIQAVGALMFVLPLLWPRAFFPLVWGGVLLLLEPLNYRREPGRSLLGDLERGRPGRVLRLLVGGAMIGLLWELYNIGARSKWIYTVPGLEELKLFEMPVLGFLGFPPFALECFAIWQALVLGGVAVPWSGRVRSAPPGARRGAAAAALAFAAAMLYGMEQRTISSYSPGLDELPGVPAAALERVGYDVFALAAAAPADVARRLGGQRVAGRTEDRAGPSPDRAREWVDRARLAALRGIGTENARRLLRVGVGSVEELARADPRALVGRLRTSSDRPVVEARVRVWVRAAREAAARSG